MSQNDFSIANADGQTVLNDLNDALQALASQSKGASAPSTTYSGQVWWDTTNNLLKIRNDGNNGWITWASFDGSTFIPYRSGTALGTAATKNVGTGSSNVPQNSDLGSASTQDTGKTIGDVAQYEDDGNSNPVINHPNMPEVSGTAIVESGSNSDGYWVRYSDGTQIAFFDEDDGNTVSTSKSTNSGVQRSATTNNDEYEWSFPKSFNFTPAVTSSVSEITACSNVFDVNQNNASIGIFDFNGNNDTYNVAAIAVGTWT